MSKEIHSQDEVTSSSRFDRERLEYPVSQAYPAIAPPSFPCRLGSSISILIDGNLEGLLPEKQAHHESGKELTRGCRCPYIFFCSAACTDYWLAWCSPGDNRHAPRCCPPKNIRFVSVWTTDRSVVHAGARVSKMARRCFWVTTSPEFATSLHRQNTSEGDAVRLASLAHHHICQRNVGRG